MEARVLEEKKINKACEIMQEIGFSKEKIEMFKKHCIKTSSMSLYKNYPIIFKKMRELAENNNLVYAILPGVGEFEKTATILYIPDYEEDFEYLFTNFGNGTFRVFAYVINFENIEYSESGSVLLTWSIDNKLVRVG